MGEISLNRSSAVRLHGFASLLLSIGWQAVAASAQSVPDSPPTVTVAAAADGFHEYEGATFDQILSSDSTLPASLLISKRYDPSSSATAFTPGQPLPTYLSVLANHSDVGFIGVPLRAWSVPTADHAFAITIYLVHIINLGYSRDQNRREGDNVYVARAGGEIDYQNHHYKAIDPEFPQFTLNQPLIFIGNDLAPNLYKIYSNRVFEIHNSSVQEATASKSHARVFERKTPFDTLREASDAWQREGQYLRTNR